MPGAFSISNLTHQTISSHFQIEQPAKLLSRLQKQFKRKAAHKRLVRYSLLSINVLLLAGVIGFVVIGPRASQATVLHSAATTSATASNALDQLSSADVAVSVARMVNLPEATAVKNQADSSNAQLVISQVSDSLVSKPQIVATLFKSNKDIQTYVAKSGDSVSKIAAKFSVTSDSIRWSNNLTGDTVIPGQKLLISPVNGIIYTVRAGDTADSLASHYGTTSVKIIAYNDAEISGLKVGERIIIPGGQPAGTTQVASFSGSGGSSFGFPWGSGPVYGYNGYDYGFCTWYVASRIAVPSNWGNASTWDNLAPLSGWTVSSAPRVGSIAQTDYAAGGEGHVAIVQSVSSDGSKIKYSDMNGLAGWGAVGYSGWVPASTFEHYIYH